MWTKVRFGLVACIASVGLVGCGGEKLAPVEGTVLAEGKTVPHGSLLFKPIADKGNKTQHEPAGNIDATGRYEIFTDGKKGAPLGWYKVIVIATEPIDPAKPYEPRKSFISSKYQAEQTTDVVLEVVDKPGPDAYRLSLKK